MSIFEQHLINSNTSVIEALDKLNYLSENAVLFFVDEEHVLLGSLTDGDIRRGLINQLTLNDDISLFINSNPHYVRQNSFDIHQLLIFRNDNIRIIPILSYDSNKIIDVINFNKQKSVLPIDVIVMAGGRGERLKPMTDTIPKPLLIVGNKPIIRYSIDRLVDFGVTRFHISVRYLGDMIKSYFETEFIDNKLYINYITEDRPLGTIGAVKQIINIENDIVLLTNSDLLTNLNYEDFYIKFIDSNADLAIATISSEINIPYGVLECKDNIVSSIVEKPTYTYFSNGGIYLFKKNLISLIPDNSFYNATDLIDQLLLLGKKVISYPIHNYWLDIGRPEDFQKAKDDIKNINF